MSYYFRTALAVFFFALPHVLFSQPGIAEFYQAEQKVNRWYFGFSDLVMVIGAIAGLIGGLRVFTNWQSGKHHIDSQVMAWFLSCLFLSIIGSALKALYGIN